MIAFDQPNPSVTQVGGQSHIAVLSLKPSPGNQRITQTRRSPASHIFTFISSAPVLLVLLTLLLYWPTTHFDFVQYDDNDYVFDNQTVRAGLTWWGLVWSFVDAHALNWHPITWLSHMLDCQIFGLNAGAHHMVNVVLHCANAALLFVLLRTMTAPSPTHRGSFPLSSGRGERGEGEFSARAHGEGDSAWTSLWRCAFVAALFAWHPLRVESVAWISERKDVLSGFFFMLTLLMYAKYVKENPAEPPSSSMVMGRGHYYSFSLAFFTLGLLSKSMLVTVPLILLLLDFWPLRRFSVDLVSGFRCSGSSIQRLVREKLPFFSLSFIVAVITYSSQRSGGAVVSLQSEGIGVRIATALTAYVGYLEKTFWPRDLSIIYLRPDSIPIFTIILAAALLLGVTLWALRSILKHGTGTFSGGPGPLDFGPQNSQIANRKSAMAVGWLWFLLMLLPVCGLVQVGPQLFADRYTYLPSIGLAILLAWALPDLLAHLFHVLSLQRFNALTLQRLALTALLLACALLTRHQLAFWRNTETLMTRALDVDPKNYIAHQDLAVYYSKLGQIDAARAHRQKFRELDPLFR